MSATIVIWGLYNDIYVQPYLERVQPKWVTYKPDSTYLSLAVPQTITFQVVTQQLPQQARYLSFFGLGLHAYENDDYTSTIYYTGLAIGAAQEKNLGGVSSFLLL